MTIKAATTRLDVVNLMLGAIGEAPVNSLSTNGIGDVATATSILDYNDRQLQAVGWHWNTDQGFQLKPNTAGEILIPNTALKVDIEPLASSLDLVKRGSRLYDRVNHTYNIGVTVPVTLVQLLPFEDIPESARNYITIKSIRQMQGRVMGADVGQAYSSNDELQAWIDLRADEAELADYNYLSDTHIQGIVGNG